MKINIHWLRRDLRLMDNTALNEALKSDFPLMLIFIFDTNIINELHPDDPRISFIHHSLDSIDKELRKKGSSLKVLKGDPEKIWKDLVSTYEINAVYINKDYEPYATARDNAIRRLLESKKISFLKFKDQVIFEEREVVKSDGNPYTVFTPYSKRWLQKLSEYNLNKPLDHSPATTNLFQYSFPFPSLSESGFRESKIKVKDYNLEAIKDYNEVRNYPAIDRTSYLSPHLRFGTVSIRSVVAQAFKENPVFLNELIWREFFMQILYHFPRIVTENFKPVYDNIQWRNNEKEFERWCCGETGYPIIDAGMRQLNTTGYMHNRIRMITAGFLCKHLLIDWRWGESYFAEKLLDYELSSNNGNWQWAAGTGCDAAPYFRIFNPETQQKKIDPDNEYVNKWIKDLGKTSYPEKIIDHDLARQRAIQTFKNGLKKILYK